MSHHPLTFLAPEHGFLGLPDATPSAEPGAARACVLPFGLEASVSYGSGTSLGPQAIIDASAQVELFDETFWCEPYLQYGVATCAPVTPLPSLDQALEQLADLVGQIRSAGKFPLVLGGEHALTPGAIRPFVESGQPLTILQFDAHADLRDGYDGEHYSHASAMCRCLDYPNVRLVSVGIRNISAEEIPILEANRDRVQIFWAKDQSQWFAHEVAEAVGTGPVYITFDVDGFDSSVMPATGTPEPGGLFWWDVMACLDALYDAGTQIVGADVVELAPKENLHACDFVAAKLVYKLLSYALAKKQAGAD